MSALQHKLLHRRSDAESSPAGEQSDVFPRRHVPPTCASGEATNGRGVLVRYGANSTIEDEIG